MRHYVYKLICWKFIEVNLKARVVDGSNKCRLSFRRPMFVSVWNQTETKPLLESLSLKLHVKSGRISGLKSAKELQRGYMATLRTLPYLCTPGQSHINCLFLRNYKTRQSWHLQIHRQKGEWEGGFQHCSTIWEALCLKDTDTFCNFIQLVKVMREWCISDSRVLTVSHQSSLGSADSLGHSVIE